MTKKAILVYIVKSNSSYTKEKYTCYTKLVAKEDIIKDIADNIEKYKLEDGLKYITTYNKLTSEIISKQSLIKRLRDSIEVASLEGKDTESDLEYLNKTIASLEIEKNKLNEVFKNTSNRIKDTICDRSVMHIHVYDSKNMYSYYSKELQIFVLNKKHLQPLNIGYLIGELENELKLRKKQRKEKLSKEKKKVNHYYSVVHGYNFRKDPVPYTGGYHKGATSSKRGNGYHSRVLLDSIPEYKEFHNRHKYKFIDWDYPYRCRTKSWKNSKVRKQYLKHDSNKRKQTKVYKETTNSIKNYFKDDRTTEEILNSINLLKTS